MMNSFLIDFLSYFYPGISSVPEWLQVFLGVILLVLFVKFLLVMIERR